MSIARTSDANPESAVGGILNRIEATRVRRSKFVHAGVFPTRAHLASKQQLLYVVEHLSAITNTRHGGRAA